MGFYLLSAEFLSLVKYTHCVIVFDGHWRRYNKNKNEDFRAFPIYCAMRAILNLFEASIKLKVSYI